MQFSATRRRVASHKCDVQKEGESACIQAGILMARLVASSLRAGTCKRNPRRCAPRVGHDGARL